MEGNKIPIGQIAINGRGIRINHELCFAPAGSFDSHSSQQYMLSLLWLVINTVKYVSIKQACKPRSYASLKLRLIYSKCKATNIAKKYCQLMMRGLWGPIIVCSDFLQNLHTMPQEFSQITSKSSIWRDHRAMPKICTKKMLYIY